MTDQTLNNLCSMGAFPNAFIYHICGLPWAATNDVAFAKWINQTGTDQTALRANLFGDDSLNVQVLANLSNDIGSQTVKYLENKGIEVGGWSVGVSSENVGFVWKNGTSMEQWGLIGLDWQPVESTFNAGHSMLITDVIPDLDNDNQCVIQWDKNKDFNLSDWLLDNEGEGAYLEDLYIYVGSSCLRPIGQLVEGDSFSVVCESGKLNAPNEDILSLSQGQNIFVSNYPQGIEGLTANLYSVMFENNNLISGTTPYFMRTGKVKNNAACDNAGNWKISMGGFTDQLKFKNTIGSYSGYLSGYQFNNNDYDGNSFTKEYKTPLMTVTEILEPTAGGSTLVQNVTITTGSNYLEFTDTDSILDHLVVQMNASPLNLVYSRSGDDIVYDASAYSATHEVSYVAVRGLAPIAAGIGYTCTTSGFEYYLNTITDPINNNFCEVLSDPYPVQRGHFFLRDITADYYDVKSFSGINDGVNVVIRTKPLDYFYQYDIDQSKRDGTNYEYYKEQLGTHIPENSLSTRTLTIQTSGTSSIELQAGMTLQFGNFSDEVEGLSIHGEVSTITDNAVTFVSNFLIGAPTGIYSNSKVLEAIYTDPEYTKQVALFAELSGITIDDVLAKFTGDLFAIKDKETVILENATDLFKGVLGDPDTDVGFNIGAVKTDIKNLFNRGESNFIPLLDWDKFETLLNANAIDGVMFKYTPESNGIDILSLLAGICLTHNLQMIWEYNPVYRSWWLTFDDFGAGNGTTATLAGRSITTQDIATNDLTAVVGGSWYYNKLSGKYKSVDGGNIELNYQLVDGRVGHSLHDKVLSINDKITLLPIDSIDAQNTIIEHFTAMTRLFSQIVYKQKLTLNLRKTALLGVGRWSSVAWSPIQNRQTGRRNDGDLIGQVQSMTTNLSSGLIMIDVLSYPSDKTGIAPALYADGITKNGDVLTLTDINTDPTINDFGDKDKLLTDLMYFGCINDEAGVLVDRDCDCTGYKITIFERNPTDSKLYFDPAYGTPSQNVFKGIMDKVTTATGSTVDITLDGGGGLFDTAKEWVVIFADRADSDLQSCQTSLYGWLADNKNQVTTSTATKLKGIQVGN